MMDNFKENPIPVIEFSKLGLNVSQNACDNDALKTIGSQIRKSFSKSGFCYLTNHGIPQFEIDNFMDISKQFFFQTTEDKMKYARGKERNFGWVAVERESLNPDRPGDLKEAFNYLPSDDPNNWPTPEFQNACKEMFRKCTELSLRVLDALSVGLNLDKSHMRAAHECIGMGNNATTLRSLYYPALTPESSIKPGQIRLGEHSDYGSITLLFQDEIGGLEVDIPGHGFVPAPPIPETVVVNIGDLMQRWTSDALVATKHRVLIPEVEFKKRLHRQSVAFFAHPDDEFLIKCLDGSDKYEPVTSGDYVKQRFGVTY